MSNMISQYHIIYSPDITMKKNGSNVCVCVWMERKWRQIQRHGM